MRSFHVFLLAILLTACAPLSTPSQEGPEASVGQISELAGVLGGETALRGEVLVTGDILVPRGSNLTIHPGTTVRVQPSNSTKIDPEFLSPATEILVRGTLRVLGTAEQPVHFLPQEASTESEYAWAGIALDRSGPSEISHARIEGAETGILCIASSPVVHASTITGSRYGLVAQEGSAPLVSETRIEKGEGGVFCWRGSHPRMVGNTIAGQAEEGIFVDATSRPRLEDNVVTGNAIGLAIYPRDLDFDSGQILNNDEDVRLLGPEGGK